VADQGLRDDRYIAIHPILDALLIPKSHSVYSLGAIDLAIEKFADSRATRRPPHLCAAAGLSGGMSFAIRQPALSGILNLGLQRAADSFAASERHVTGFLQSTALAFCKPPD
jgi:hypothetical protein